MLFTASLTEAGLLRYLEPLRGTTATQQQNQRQATLGKYSPDATKANAIKEAFRYSWEAYYDHAFPHDSLRVVEQSYEDDR